MAVNYQNRLQKLRDRRSPFATVATEALSKSLVGRALQEKFETQAEGVATRYALGCMEALPSRYTEISFQEGERVANQLKNSLPANMPIETRIQGSLALDIHIKASSDVDLLVLAKWFLTYDPQPAAGQVSYTTLPFFSTLDGLQRLRTASYLTLCDKFPAVHVDNSKPKAITMSGGSLARKIDVVPSHWHDTASYQQNPEVEALRGVKILDNSAPTAILNLPFLHIALINRKDQATGGHAKRAIRLLKCLSRDAEVELSLSSYDIAGLVFHMDNNVLNVNQFTPLQLLNRVEVYLRSLEENSMLAINLDTPDNTRKILNEASKFRDICSLRREVGELIQAVAAECEPLTKLYPATPSIAQAALDRKRIFS